MELSERRMTLLIFLGGWPAIIVTALQHSHYPRKIWIETGLAALLWVVLFTFTPVA
jgi:hypothetical protein